MVVIMCGGYKAKIHIRRSCFLQNSNKFKLSISSFSAEGEDVVGVVVMMIKKWKLNSLFALHVIVAFLHEENWRKDFCKRKE